MTTDKLHHVYWIQRTAFILGGLGVIAGAFGAHSLKASLTLQRMQSWETAVFYQFIHVFLMLYLCNNRESHFSRLGMNCALVGILLFSGSLYLLCLTDVSLFGMVTPIGGLAFIVAWGSAFISSLNPTKSGSN